MLRLCVLLSVPPVPRCCVCLFFFALSLACTEIFLLHSAVSFKRVHISKVILNSVVSPTPMPILGEGDVLEAIELD